MWLQRGLTNGHIRMQTKSNEEPMHLIEFNVERIRRKWKMAYDKFTAHSIRVQCRDCAARNSRGAFGSLRFAPVAVAPDLLRFGRALRWDTRAHATHNLMRYRLLPVALTTQILTASSDGVIWEQKFRHDSKMFAGSPKCDAHHQPAAFSAAVPKLAQPCRGHLSTRPRLSQRAARKSFTIFSDTRLSLAQVFRRIANCLATASPRHMHVLPRNGHWPLTSIS